MKLPNLNTILAVVGIACEFAPDVTGLAAWLTSLNVGWITHVAHGLGVIALLMASLPQIITRLRAPLAALGLATPPGAQAPWNPAKDNVIPMVQAPLVDQGASAHAIPLFPTSSEDAKTPIIRPTVNPFK